MSLLPGTNQGRSNKVHPLWEPTSKHPYFYSSSLYLLLPPCGALLATRVRDSDSWGRKYRVAPSFFKSDIHSAGQFVQRNMRTVLPCSFLSALPPYPFSVRDSLRSPDTCPPSQSPSPQEAVNTHKIQIFHPEASFKSWWAREAAAEILNYVAAAAAPPPPPPLSLSNLILCRTPIFGETSFLTGLMRKLKLPMKLSRIYFEVSRDR